MFQSRISRLSAPARVLLLGAAGILAVGCSGKVSEENYNKIEVGMTRAQVDKMLGRGKDNTALQRGPEFVVATPGVADRSIQYGGESEYILVLYRSGKVLAKDKQGF